MDEFGRVELLSIIIFLACKHHGILPIGGTHDRTSTVFSVSCCIRHVLITVARNTALVWVYLEALNVCRHNLLTFFTDHKSMTT